MIWIGLNNQESKTRGRLSLGLASFFFGKKKNSATDMSKSCANPSSDTVGTGDATRNAAAAAGSVLFTAPSTGVLGMTRNLTSCHGIYADYRGRMKDNLTAFSVYASIQGNPPIHLDLLVHHFSISCLVKYVPAARALFELQLVAIFTLVITAMN